MKKYTSEEKKEFCETMNCIASVIIVMTALTFLAFFWISCQDLTKVLDFIVERMGLR